MALATTLFFYDCDATLSSEENAWERIDASFGPDTNLEKHNMNLTNAFDQYWPFAALILWFGYKWWNSRRVVALLPQLKQQGALLIDVRSAGEFASANAPGTINIPLPELASRLAEIPKSSPVVLCCASGTRSGMAKLLLKKNGYQQVYNIGTWGKLLD